MKKTLLDLDRVPTLEEMIEFFHDNDWTTAKIYSDDERTPEMNAEILHMKRLIKVKYDALAKEMGRKNTLFVTVKTTR